MNKNNTTLYGSDMNITAKELWEQNKDDLIPLFNLGLMSFNRHNKSELTLDDVIKTIEEEFGENGYFHLLAAGNRFSELNALAKNNLLNKLDYTYFLTEVSQFLYSTVNILMQKKRKMNSLLDTIHMLLAEMSDEEENKND